MDKVIQIRELLKKNNASYDTLAKYLGKTTQTVANYLNSRSKIDIDTFEKIAIFLKVPVSYFFEESSSAQKNITGNGNRVSINSKNFNNNTRAESDNELLEKIILLEKTIKDKEEIIDLLKSKKA